MITQLIPRSKVTLACATQWRTMLNWDGQFQSPVTDSQDYDLVVDNGTRLFKVQVKTTKSISPSGNYIVSLRTIGGNRSGTGKCKDFSENSSDLLFALTDSGDCYSIPKSEISAVSSVALGERYLPYRVTLH